MGHAGGALARGNVATSPVALRWMCDSPRTGCARRTIIYIYIYIYRYVARTSNNRVSAAPELYCCLLPRCEALRTCRSGFSDRNSKHHICDRSLSGYQDTGGWEGYKLWWSPTWNAHNLEFLGWLICVKWHIVLEGRRRIGKLGWSSPYAKRETEGNALNTEASLSMDRAVTSWFFRGYKMIYFVVVPNNSTCFWKFRGAIARLLPSVCEPVSGHPGKVYAKYHEERCREIIELKLGIASAVFTPAVVLQTKFSLSSKFLKNLGGVPKTSRHILSTSRKYTTGFLVKSFGVCCGSTVLTAAVTGC